MKPRWEDAPEWANWLAMDADGGWFWYENEPAPIPQAVWSAPEGRQKLAAREENEWGSSKESRP